MKDYLFMYGYIYLNNQYIINVKTETKKELCS